MSNQTYNFCAGPAALPKPVMEAAQRELLDWQGLGISVMEISHRSAEYQQLAKQAEANLRQLLGISSDYAVLFLQGGASLQFSNIPMSLLGEGREAEYLSNGVWSGKAAAEAARFGKVNKIDVINIDSDGTRSLTEPATWNRSESPVYTHYTPNETIEGIRFDQVVETPGALVADLSSSILSEQINVSDYDFIYAGAQKNIGPSGMTIVIVKRELFAQMDFSQLPKILNYELQAEQASMVNTPPTYTWYLASLVFEWLLGQGGVAKMEQLAKQRASLLYGCIDEDDFYRNPIAVKDRSRMNVPFILRDESLNDSFLKQAQQAGLIGLKGHRSVGGMRASIYNSMPVEGVEVLTEFMREFKRVHG